MTYYKICILNVVKKNEGGYRRIVSLNLVLCRHEIVNYRYLFFVFSLSEKAIGKERTLIKTDI